MSLTDENADMIKAKLLTPLKIGSFVMFGLLGFGALLIVIAFILIVLPDRNKNDKSDAIGRPVLFYAKRMNGTLDKDDQIISK